MAINPILKDLNGNLVIFLTEYGVSIVTMKYINKDGKDLFTATEWPRNPIKDIKEMMPYIKNTKDVPFLTHIPEDTSAVRLNWLDPFSSNTKGKQIYILDGKALGRGGTELMQKFMGDVVNDKLNYKVAKDTLEFVEANFDALLNAIKLLPDQQFQWVMKQAGFHQKLKNKYFSGFESFRKG